MVQENRKIITDDITIKGHCNLVLKLGINIMLGMVFIKVFMNM